MATQAPSKEQIAEALRWAQSIVRDQDRGYRMKPSSLEAARALLHLAAELDQAREREKALRAALEFYAKATSYVGIEPRLYERIGEIARAALALR